MRILASLLVLIVLPVDAKCISAPYEVVGSVLSIGGGPAPTALIEVSWREFGDRLATERVISNPDGRFKLNFTFNLLSGENSDGDICDAALSSVTVHITAAGFRPYDGILLATGSKMEANYSLQPTNAPSARRD
jgi:hypothetical protein